MKWFLVIYLTGSEGVMVSKESFKSLDECGTYFNEVQKDLKNVSDVRCVEVNILNSKSKDTSL